MLQEALQKEEKCPSCLVQLSFQMRQPHWQPDGTHWAAEPAGCNSHTAGRREKCELVACAHKATPGCRTQRRRDLSECEPHVKGYSADGCPADRRKVEADPDGAHETAGTRRSMSTGGGGTGKSAAGVLTAPGEMGRMEQQRRCRQETAAELWS